MEEDKEEEDKKGKKTPNLMRRGSARGMQLLRGIQTPAKTKGSKGPKLKKSPRSSTIDGEGQQSSSFRVTPKKTQEILVNSDPASPDETLSVDSASLAQSTKDIPKGKPRLISGKRIRLPGRASPTPTVSSLPSSSYDANTTDTPFMFSTLNSPSRTTPPTIERSPPKKEEQKKEELPVRFSQGNTNWASSDSITSILKGEEDAAEADSSTDSGEGASARSFLPKASQSIHLLKNEELQLGEIKNQVKTIQENRRKSESLCQSSIKKQIGIMATSENCELSLSEITPQPESQTSLEVSTENLVLPPKATPSAVLESDESDTNSDSDGSSSETSDSPVKISFRTSEKKMSPLASRVIAFTSPSQSQHDPQHEPSKTSPKKISPTITEPLQFDLSSPSFARLVSPVNKKRSPKKQFSPLLSFMTPPTKPGTPQPSRVRVKSPGGSGLQPRLKGKRPQSVDLESQSGLSVLIEQESAARREIEELQSALQASITREHALLARLSRLEKQMKKDPDENQGQCDSLMAPSLGSPEIPNSANEKRQSGETLQDEKISEEDSLKYENEPTTEAWKEIKESWKELSNVLNQNLGTSLLHLKEKQILSTELNSSRRRSARSNLFVVPPLSTPPSITPFSSSSLPSPLYSETTDEIRLPTANHYNMISQEQKLVIADRTEGKIFVLCSEDQKGRSKGQTLTHIETGNDRIYGLVSLPDLLLVLLEDGSILLYKTSDWEQLSSVPSPHTQLSRCFIFVELPHVIEPPRSCADKNCPSQFLDSQSSFESCDTSIPKDPIESKVGTEDPTPLLQSGTKRNSDISEEVASSDPNAQPPPDLENDSALKRESEPPQASLGIIVSPRAPQGDSSSQPIPSSEVQSESADMETVNIEPTVRSSNTGQTIRTLWTADVAGLIVMWEIKDQDLCKVHHFETDTPVLSFESIKIDSLTFLVFGSVSGIISVISVDEGRNGRLQLQRVVTDSHNQQEIRCIIGIPSMQEVWTTGMDGRIFVWRVSHLDLDSKRPDPQPSVAKGIESLSDLALIQGSNLKDLSHPLKWSLRNIATAHRDRVSSFCLCYDRFVCSASYDRTVCVWDSVNLVLLQTLDGHLAPVTSVVQNETKSFGLWTVSVDGLIRCWDNLRDPNYLPFHPLNQIIAGGKSLLDRVSQKEQLPVGIAPKPRLDRQQLPQETSDVLSNDEETNDGSFILDSGQSRRKKRPSRPMSSIYVSRSLTFKNVQLKKKVSPKGERDKLSTGDLKSKSPHGSPRSKQTTIKIVREFTERGENLISFANEKEESKKATEKKMKRKRGRKPFMSEYHSTSALTSSFSKKQIECLERCYQTHGKNPSPEVTQGLLEDLKSTSGKDFVAFDAELVSLWLQNKESSEKEKKGKKSILSKFQTVSSREQSSRDFGELILFSFDVSFRSLVTIHCEASVTPSFMHFSADLTGIGKREMQFQDIENIYLSGDRVTLEIEGSRSFSFKTPSDPCEQIFEKIFEVWQPCRWRQYLSLLTQCQDKTRTQRPLQWLGTEVRERRGIVEEVPIECIDNLLLLLRIQDSPYNAAAAAILFHFYRNSIHSEVIMNGGAGDLLSFLIRFAKAGWMEVYNAIEPSDVELVRVIGKGAAGTVWEARWKNEIYAVKKIPSLGVVADTILSEVVIMSVITHPNIVHCVAASLSPQCLIVTELLSRGSIEELIDKKIDLKPRLSSILLDAAKGVAYLHRFELIHRDLKPGNLLVRDDWTVAIADFGISRIVSARMTRAMGTSFYIAPEVFVSNSYSTKADVYSFSYIMWGLWAGEVPYQKISTFALIPEILEKNRRPPIDPTFPLTDLMKRCWQADPALRPSFNEIVSILTKRDAEMPSIPPLEGISPQVPPLQVPPLQVDLISPQHSSQEVEVASPSAEEVPPQVEIIPPQVEVSSPEIKVASPPLKVSSPPVQVSSPPFKVSSPVQIPLSPLKVSSPPVQISPPPFQVSPPQLRLPSSPLKVSSPPVQISPPPFRVSSPQIRVASPQLAQLEETAQTQSESLCLNLPQSSEPSCLLWTGSHVLVGDYSDGLYLWSQEGTFLKSFSTDKRRVFRFFQLGRLAIAVLEDGSLFILDPTNSTLVSSISSPHSQLVRSAVLIPTTTPESSNLSPSLFDPTLESLPSSSGSFSSTSSSSSTSSASSFSVSPPRLKPTGTSPSLSYRQFSPCSRTRKSPSISVIRSPPTSPLARTALSPFCSSPSRRPLFSLSPPPKAPSPPQLPSSVLPPPSPHSSNSSSPFLSSEIPNFSPSPSSPSPPSPLPSPLSVFRELPTPSQTRNQSLFLTADVSGLMVMWSVEDETFTFIQQRKTSKAILALEHFIFKGENFVVVGCTGGNIFVWPVPLDALLEKKEDIKEVEEIKDDEIFPVANGGHQKQDIRVLLYIESARSQIWSAAKDSEICVWGIESESRKKGSKLLSPHTPASPWVLISSLKRHGDRISDLCFIQRIRTVCSISLDQFLILWEPMTRTPIKKLKRHEGPVTAIASHPGNAMIWTTSLDKTLRLWKDFNE